MDQDEPVILAAAVSIADGTAVDWQSVEETARDEQERALARQLKIVESIAELHRTGPVVADQPLSSTSEATVEQPAGAVAPSRPPAGGVHEPAVEFLEKGRRWGPLTILERVGEGSSGDVYRAWDTKLERDVALKLLRPGSSSQDRLAQKILHEGRMLARVRHPNVITIYGTECFDGLVGYWMEFIRGFTLEQALRKQGPFGARETTLIGLDLCRALAAVHGAGLVHRDVKAHNVMREQGGRIVLMDFGTGQKIEQMRGVPERIMAGTPLYLAPEIFQHGEATPRSDIYSLGVLLYHLVTGAYPVNGRTVDELCAAHEARLAVHLRDRRPDLPDGFLQVIERALSPEPERRFESAGAMETVLAGSLGFGLGTPAVLETPPSDARITPDTGAGGQVAVSTPAPQAVPVPWPRLPRAGRAGLWPAVVGASVLAALALGVAWNLGGLRDRVFPDAAASPVRSIAVLPLANLSGDPSQQYFVDGMTDELIATLGKITALNVISRTSVMPFKGSGSRLPDIAKALKVDAVLEGSVLLAPGAGDNQAAAPKRVRIAARLIHAGTDTQLWSGTFEKDLQDVLGLQNEVARSIAGEINVRLTPSARRQLERFHVAPPAAQEAYLEARYDLNTSNTDRIKQAVVQFKEAIRLDPQYALAYASLARSYVLLDFRGALPPADARLQARTAATQALQLDDGLPEAYTALADVKFYYDWDWVGAEQAYKRAIELNSSYSLARSQYARFLAAQERLREAMDEARRAQESDPFSREMRNTVGMMFYYQRDYDRAIEQFRRALELDPESAAGYFVLGRGHAGKGEWAEATAAIQQALERSGQDPVYLAELGRTHAAAGRKDKAREILQQLRDEEAHLKWFLDPQSMHVIAYVHAALGDHDTAFTLLNRAIDERSTQLLWVKVDPRADSLRSDPRFPALVRRVGPHP